MNEDDPEENAQEAFPSRFETDPLKHVGLEFNQPKFGFDYGILNDKHEVVTVRSLSEWGAFYETDNRRVAETTINGFWVSTVFLGLNHNFGGDRPLWFETMIFKDEENPPPAELDGRIEEWCKDTQWRYSTWQEAVEGHETLVEMIRLGIF